MKNCSQCPNMSDVGKNNTCKFYNRVISNVDKIPIWCELYPKKRKIRNDFPNEGYEKLSQREL